MKVLAKTIPETLRFELRNGSVEVIGRYQTKTEALEVAIPGDSLFDCMAREGEIELWIVGGDMGSKVLRAIRRKQ